MNRDDKKREIQSFFAWLDANPNKDGLSIEDLIDRYLEQKDRANKTQVDSFDLAMESRRKENCDIKATAKRSLIGADISSRVKVSTACAKIMVDALMMEESVLKAVMLVGAAEIDNWVIEAGFEVEDEVAAAALKAARSVEESDELPAGMGERSGASNES